MIGPDPKGHRTGIGPADLAFPVGPAGEPADLDGQLDASRTADHQVFHWLVNLTGDGLTGVETVLGFGSGDGFVRSAADDGSGFSTTTRVGPGTGLQPISLRPLRRRRDRPAHHMIDGFFADERSSSEVGFGEDLFASDGIHGPTTTSSGRGWRGRRCPRGCSGTSGTSAWRSGDGRARAGRGGWCCR